MKRQHERDSDQPGEVGKCCQRLHDTARKLTVREYMDDRAAKNVDDAITLLTTRQTNSQTRPYQAFLHDVLRHCSPSLVLLCAGSLGRKRIIDLGKVRRVSLLAYVRNTQESLDVPILETLANERDIPSFHSQ